jgi:hypothetical protein
MVEKAKKIQVMWHATQNKMFLQKANTKMKKGGAKIICKNILFCVARHITWNVFAK